MQLQQTTQTKVYVCAHTHRSHTKKKKTKKSNKQNAKNKHQR